MPAANSRRDIEKIAKYQRPSDGRGSNATDHSYALLINVHRGEAGLDGGRGIVVRLRVYADVEALARIGVAMATICGDSHCELWGEP